MALEFQMSQKKLLTNSKFGMSAYQNLLWVKTQLTNNLTHTIFLQS